jgi:hypothetical protein
MKPSKRSRVDALTPTGAAITVSAEALPNPDMVPINGSLEEDILDQQSLGVRFLASRQFPQTSTGLDAFDANAFIEKDDLSYDDYLFSSNVPMGANLALGFVISASYGCKFGKMFLRIEKGSRCLLLRDYSRFLHYLSLSMEAKKELAGKNGVYGIDDVTIYFSKNNNMTLLQHAKAVGADVDILTLNSKELNDIEKCIGSLEYYQLLHFKMLEKITGESITDIQTACKKYAQDHCGACKEIGSSCKPHTCICIPNVRFDRVLRAAMSPHNKWPFSRALEDVYKRLAGHAEYFKQDIQQSIAWNQQMNTFYKTAEMPYFILHE